MTNEEKIYSLTQSRDNYKRLYEKERSIKGDKVALRESDKTKLLAIRDYINELIGRWSINDTPKR